LACQARAQTATDLPVHWPNAAAPLPASIAPKVRPPPPPPPPGPDGLGQNGFYLEADTLTRDDNADRWTAEGQVEARYQGRVIRADKITYNVGVGTVIADGHAQIINA